MDFSMPTLNWPLHKYVMMFLIVALGNMLGKHFGNFGNPLESYKNTMGTFWKLGGNILGTKKIKIKIALENNFETIPKNKLELTQL
jgi:hypothetical protein